MPKDETAFELVPPENNILVVSPSKNTKEHPVIDYVLTDLHRKSPISIIGYTDKTPTIGVVLRWAKRNKVKVVHQKLEWNAYGDRAPAHAYVKLIKNLRPKRCILFGGGPIIGNALKTIRRDPTITIQKEYYPS